MTFSSQQPFMENLIDIFWTNNSDPGKAIIVVIIFLFLVSSIAALQHIWRYKKVEAQWLYKVTYRLKDQQGAEDAAGVEGQANEKEPTPHAVKVNELMQGIPLDSMIGDRLNTVAKMIAAKVQLDASALQQISLAREARRQSLQFPQFVGNLSMMLGLLGTIIGLSLMVQSLGVNLDRALQGSDFNNVFSSLKTAFAATLFGLISSIGSSVFNAWLSNAQHEFFERLERFTIEDLLPAVAPSIKNEELLKQLNRQLEKSLIRFQQVSDQNRKTIEDLSTVENTFQIILKNVERATRNASAGSSQQVVAQLTNVIQEMTRSNASMVSLTGSLPRVVSQMERVNQATLARIDGVSGSSQSQVVKTLLVCGGVIFFVVMLIVLFR
jgi:biopolymer transport protein ExbB/TolQ